MDYPKAEVITIGDEILYGHITDTNSQFICNELNQAGFQIEKRSSVGDDKNTITGSIEQAFQSADIVITTGGLGPTKDDITKKAICNYFNCELKRDEETLQRVTEYFRKKGREITELNRQQADIPSIAKAIPNNNGTAPGIWIESQEGKICISIPGIPVEMKALIVEQVIPRLKNSFKTPIIIHKIVNTTGLGESSLSEKIEDWENQLPAHIKLAYLPSMGIIKLKLSGIGNNKKALEQEIDNQIEKLKTYIPDLIIGYDEKNKLEEVIGDLLVKQKATLATAESCTGGYLAHLITTIAGSSAYFKGSVVAYNNSIKMQELGVQDDILKKHGAVSEATVKAMAEGICNKMQSSYGIATSGISGPSGGTEEKPVGTVWIACSDGKKTKTHKLQLFTDRLVNIHFSAIYAMDLLRKKFLME